MQVWPRHIRTIGCIQKVPGRDDELARLRATAEKAIELDPLLAEAHCALAMCYARDGQWQPSEKSFRHAIELDPVTRQRTASLH
jgi:Tfp pilus assembly protein PilF